MAVRLIRGDCVEVMRELEADSVDAIVTDPPYALSFMGRGWDTFPTRKDRARKTGSGKPSVGYGFAGGVDELDNSIRARVAFQEWSESWAVEALRVLKPGGHLLAFGGARTFHRLTCAIEDAGFEIRDTIGFLGLLGWVYASGFPKGRRIDNAIIQEARAWLLKEHAPYVEQVSGSIRLPSEREREPIALAAARIRPEGGPALLMETTKVDGSCDLTAMLLSELEAATIASNTTLSWSALSVVDYGQMKTSTIATGAEQTTIQQILNSSPLQNTHDFTTPEETPRNGWSLPACHVVGNSIDGHENTNSILALTALGSATDNLARRYEGFNVALKPAWEPIILARKPLIGTVAANVAAYGTGGLNIAATRIESGERPNILGTPKNGNFPGVFREGSRADGVTNVGRWPANVCLDEESAAALDAAVGELTSGANPTRRGSPKTRNTYGEFEGQRECIAARGVDTGGPSRFFFVARPDDNCWLCGWQKTGILSETQVSEKDAQCLKNASTLDSASTAGSNTNHRAEVAASALTHAPGQRPLSSAGNRRSDNRPAHNAASSLSSGHQTSKRTALPDARDSPSEPLAQRVKSAGNLCDSCAIAIAQRLAVTAQDQDPAHHLGWGFINERNAQILSRSLALYAESLGSTGTTPTTTSLSLLFGYVRDAIASNTPTDATAPASGLSRLRYCSKSSRAERNAGLEGMPEQRGAAYSDTIKTRQCNVCGTKAKASGPNGRYPNCDHDDWAYVDQQDERHKGSVTNPHPCVKPLSLMRWLCKLITPPGGVVLDCFAGSGSTGVACVLEGFSFIGIDSDSEYVEIARRRIEHAQGPMFADVEVAG